MKYEWKKQEKEIYGVKTKPCVVDIPAWKYIILSGSGNPNEEVFSDKVASLFSVAYKIKMEHGYKRIGKEHREIYLNHANRTEKANLKTILRYKITDIGE